MERVDVLSDDAFHDTEFPEVSDGVVARVGVGHAHGRPAEEASRPVSLSGLMAGDELVVVDGAVSLVDAIGALDASVIGQSACY